MEQLQELKAINELYAGNFERSVELFGLAGKVSERLLDADPFMIHIKDCHDCDFETPHTKYTKYTFAQKMLDLSQKANSNSIEAAAASFELANGLYNMSYYGNGRMAYTTRHDNFKPYPSENYSQEFTLNMDLAEKYYRRAMELSSNKEFKAKAIFMASKAEQNRYYYTHDRNGEDGVDIHPGVYFKMLKDSYADTQYYQDIIKECGYFRTYINKR